MILAYFLIKFSSLKMNRDLVLAPWKPGRLRWAAFFAIWPKEPSKGPVISKPSRSAPPEENVAILKEKGMKYSEMPQLSLSEITTSSKMETLSASFKFSFRSHYTHSVPLLRHHL